MYNKNVVGINPTRWVGSVSAAAHDPHLVIGAANRCEGNGSSLASSPWYTRNAGDRVIYWVIDKRIIAIMDHAAVPSAASACVDEIEDDGCRYITERDGQVRALLHPGVSSRSKLPNRIGHSSVDSESPQNV